MKKNTEKQKIYKIICHIIFIVSFLWCFGNVSILRPISYGALYKEYFSAFVLLLMLYINYLFVIPFFFMKRHYSVFLILSLISIFLASFFEMLLVMPNIITCFPSTFNEHDIFRCMIVQFFFISGRNMAFLLFFFFVRIIENERKILENERIAIAKNKGYICVSRGKDTEETISISDISYVIHERNYTYIYTIDGKEYSKYISLSNMENILPDTLFMRINRFVIISMNRIVSYSLKNITISYGEPVKKMTFPLSEKYVSNVKEKIASTVGLNVLFDGLNVQNDGLKEGNNIKNVGLNVLGLEEFRSLVKNNKELENICRMIAKEPTITMKTMSEKLQVSVKTVERKIKYLKGKDIIIHNGAKKNGEYIISNHVSNKVKNWLMEQEKEL